MLQHYLTTKHAAGSDWRKHHEPDALPLSPPSRVEGCADTHWQARTRLSLPHTYLPSNRQADARTRMPCSVASSEAATPGTSLLTYADVCCRILTYADVC